MTEPDVRPTILVLLGCFQPGNEATGPNQSMIGMAQVLSDRFRFKVIGEAVEGEEPGRWSRLDGIDRLAVQPLAVSARGLRKAINGTSHDLLVTNGFFDRVMTIPTLVMRRLGMIARKPMLLAPRGEFSPGALALGAQRKRAWLSLAQRMGLLDQVHFHATGEEEAVNLRRTLGPGASILIGPNVRLLPPLPGRSADRPLSPLRIAFLSRIDRMKNLDFLLDRVAEAGIEIRLDLYGPVSDPQYWRECQTRIDALPATVACTWHGAVPRSEVLGKLADADLFFLPTRGENYGHSIVDSLTAGTPVLISDRTPWRDVEAAGAGWSLPLDQPQAYVAALRQIDGETGALRSRRRAAARHYAECKINPAATGDLMAKCLNAAMERRGVSG